MYITTPPLYNLTYIIIFVDLCKLQTLYKFLLFNPQYKRLHVKLKAMYTLIIDTMMYQMNKTTIEIDRKGYQYSKFETEYFKKVKYQYERSH